MSQEFKNTPRGKDLERDAQIFFGLVQDLSAAKETVTFVSKAQRAVDDIARKYSGVKQGLVAETQQLWSELMQVACPSSHITNNE